MKGSAASKWMPQVSLVFIVNTNIHGKLNENTLDIIRHADEQKVGLSLFDLDS